MTNLSSDCYALPKNGKSIDLQLSVWNADLKNKAINIKIREPLWRLIGSVAFIWQRKWICQIDQVIVVLLGSLDGQHRQGTTYVSSILYQCKANIAAPPSFNRTTSVILWRKPNKKIVAHSRSTRSARATSTCFYTSFTSFYRQSWKERSIALYICYLGTT